MANAPAPQANLNLTTGALPTPSMAGKAAPTMGERDQNQMLFVNEVNPFEFMRHADNGTGGFLYGQYLTEHSRERDFRIRRNYSYFLNFTKRIISALVKPVFREEPVREVAKNEFLEKFMLNCDRRNHPFGKFIRKVARKVKRYGVYFVVVDNDKADNIAPTVAEANARNQHPYCYCYSPENVHEYDWDTLGKLSRIVFREWVKNKEGEKVWQYREFTPTSWTLYMLDEIKKGPQAGGVRKRILDEGEISIGEIPVIPVYDEEPDEDEDPILPHPPLYHIGRTNLSIFDVCSELRELERNQMFSIMRIPVSAGKMLNSMEVGSKNALAYDASSTTPPDFISPDAAIPTAIMADRKFLIEQLFEMAALVGIVGMAVKEESGRAKEWEFQSSREELTRFGHIMEDAEKEIIRIFGLYLGQKEIQYEVNYSENYGIVDMTAETLQAGEALALNISPLVNQEIRKGWTLKFFRDSKKEVVESLIKSINLQTEDEIHGNLGDRDRGNGKPGAVGEDDAAGGAGEE